MRRARPDELSEDARPIALLRLSRARLEELFPVEFSEVDSLAAAEPSIGAMVQLESGPYAVVMHGKTTGDTEVSLPVSAPMALHWAAFLREVPLIANEIVWTSDRIARSSQSDIPSGTHIRQIGEIIEEREPAHASTSDKSHR
jgi:hypothetical protein